jgi:uncharacterized membrane protein
LNPQDYKVIILVVTAVSALIVASPALQRLLVYPQTEFFTELWLLGPGHMAEGIPYNITRGDSYNVFVGVSNHLGNCTYYSLQVKFRNLNQSGPDSFNRTSSSLAPLYSVNVFVADKETWELPVTFSFDYSYDSNSSTVNFNSLTFNGAALDLKGYSTTWDSNKSVFFGNLVFELWIYNEATGGFQYHERYVDLKLNLLV